MWDGYNPSTVFFIFRSPVTIFTPAALQARLRERPFTPLRLVTSTAESYDVVHPELMMVGTHFVIVGMPTDRDSSIFGQVTRIALLHITELRDLPMPSQSSNGSA